MEAPAITRQRRPFLAPIWVTVALGIAIVLLGIGAYRSLTTTTIVLIRHAEKELGSIDNPPLAPEGELRAERLSQMFGKIVGVGRLQGIYVPDTRRTQQTAAPLAARLHLQPVVLEGSDVEAIADRAVHDHRGGVALIVGHGNTIPQMVKHLSGTDVPPLADDEFDEVYVVAIPTLGKASVLRFEY